MLLRLKGSEPLQSCCKIEWKAFPEDGGRYSSQGCSSSILPIVLERDVKQVHMGVM
uniref:Uncharacterized protein n=1 Tax=Anguilla anguilla TaxID=7936 RepID=A0A0E9TPY6_ANGAN